jgi:Cdc6-like AAA superfamily ATPase
VTVPPLSPTELVDDRALKSLEDDRFGHSHFVKELADLARQVSTPANVALYAPWGSGKTGLAQVLAAEFEDDSKVRFVHFNALKYAEAPLRRQFLSQLSRELDVKHERFTKGLYRKETTNTFSLPPGKAVTFGLLFLAALAVLMSVIVAGALVYGLCAEHRFSNDFHGALAWLAPKAFVPATLLAVVAALAGKQLGIERTVEAPSGAEEFEDAFRDLVHEAVGQRELDKFGRKSIDDKRKRLVVFIDELDRCAPDEVASTLETIRTFLEVPGCLFIVAADQQAIEEALSLKVKQATPRNVVSPYYSAGSAYLDKVFQYQLALPPLKPQRLTAFALELVDHRDGLWSRIRSQADLEEVISVLVPTHVQSPRRVKALLNNFALLYRLAEQRADDGKLSGDIAERAAELAKLACLRLEFPLFAADLMLDARMPEFVVALADDDSSAPLPTSVRPEVLDRAQKWADRKLAVDELLVSDRADASRPADADEEDDEETAARPGTRAVREEHTAQLLRYLTKTRRIPGPGRDLIHLESAAAQLDIAIDVADDLEAAAVDGNRAEVRAMVRDLDGDEQLAAYSLLTAVVRHSAVGIEGANAVGTLLEALAERKAPLNGVADDLASAIATHRYQLTSADLLGAFELSLESTHAIGDDLRERVLDHAQALNNSRLCAAVVRATDDVKATRAEQLAESVARLCAREPQMLAEALQALPLSTALEAIDIAANKVEELGDDEERIDDWAASMLDVIDQLLDRDMRPVAERYAAVLLRIPRADFPGGVAAREARLAPSTTPELALAMLTVATQVSTSEASPWLQRVDARVLEGDASSRAKALLDKVAVAAWAAVQTGTVTAASLAASLKPFADSGLIAPSDKMAEAIKTSMTGPVADAALLTERGRVAEAALQFCRLRTAPETVVGDGVIGALTETLTAGYQPIQLRPVGRQAFELYRSYYRSASSKTLTGFVGLDVPHWPGYLQSMVLMAAAELHLRDDVAAPDLPYTIESLAQWAETSMPAFAPGVAAWLQAYAMEPAEVWAVLAPLSDGELSENVTKELRALVAWWHRQGRQEAHQEFLAIVVASSVSSPVAESFLRAAKFDDAAQLPMAQHMSELCERHPGHQTVRQLLVAWKVLEPNEVPAQRALVNGILLPGAKSEDAGHFDVLLDFVGLLKGLPQDRRDAVRKALRTTAVKLDRTRELEERFERIGLKKSSGLLGLGRKQDV